MEVVPIRSKQDGVGRLAVIALGYAFTLKFALLFPDAANILGAIWPPGGVALAALLLSPRPQRRAILATIFVTGNVMNLLSGRPALASLGFMVANVLESWGGAVVFEWLSKGRRVTFSRLSDVAALIVSVLGVNSVAALVGAASALFVTHARFRSSYETWWIADGMGLMLVTPLVVTFAQPWRRSSLHLWRLIEAGALVLVWSAFAVLSFLGDTVHWPVVPRPYWMCAPLVWACLRFDPRIVTLLLAILSAMAIGLTEAGRGEFPLGGDDPEKHLQMVQLFLGALTATGLTLVAAVAERKEVEAALRISELALHESEARAAHALDQAQLAYWEMDAATSTFTFNDRFYSLYGTSAERERGYQMKVEDYAREFLPPNEKHLVALAVARLLAGEVDEFRAEHCIRRRDSELRHIAVRGQCRPRRHRPHRRHPRQ